ERQRQDGQPEEEVRHDCERVEAEDDRDPSERDLRGGPEERAKRSEPGEARESDDATRREPGREREREPDESDHAVPELDEGVEALLRVRLRAAPRPVVAPETRSRETYECARGDDDEERYARRESDTKKNRRRQRPDSGDRRLHGTSVRPVACATAGRPRTLLRSGRSPVGRGHAP